MNVASSLLAKKYAQAFYNLYEHEITGTVIDAVKNLSAYLETRKEAIFYLKAPAFDLPTKESMLNKVFEKFNMVKLLYSLGYLLNMHKRLELLPQVLQQIEKIYKKKHAIIDFTVSSAASLSDSQTAAIYTFLAKESNKKVNCAYKVDKSLIAGVRAISDTYLWERSIARDLRLIAAIKTL